MENVFSTRDNILSTALYKVNSGEEFEIEGNLKNLGHRSLYKAFGQYDILSLTDTDSFENRRIYTPCPKVVSSLSLSAFKCNVDGYSSPDDIIAWVGESPLLGIILLELDKWFYSTQSQPGSCLAAQALVTKKLYEVTQDLAEIAIYGGYGRSELYCFVKADQLEILWQVANTCRSLVSKDCFPAEGLHMQTPVFRNTQTTPCVSFTCFKKTEDGSNHYSVERINGESEADIYIKCPSAFESKIAEFFPDEIFLCKEIFGEHDILIQTKGKIDSKTIIETVINFRQFWLGEIGTPLVTKTHFKQDIKTKHGEPEDYHVDSKSPQINQISLIENWNPELPLV